MILEVRIVVTSILTAGLLSVLPTAACACDVPVARYALENWPPCVYEVIVVHQGKLPADSRRLNERLCGVSSEGSGRANFRVRTSDLASHPEARVLQLWQAAGKPAPPCILLTYPQFQGGTSVLWSKELSEDAVRILTDSFVRRQIARRLLEGDTAVWVLLESGAAEKDLAAKSLVTVCLKEAENTLKLMGAEHGMSVPRSEGILVEEYSITGLATSSQPMAIRFSLLAVSRSDSAESALVAMLEHCAPDVDQCVSEPIVLAIFGRGRVLYALAGKGITADNIDRACQFLVGPCSCTLQDQSPGMDLLLSVDWVAGLSGRVGDAREPRPLVGLSTLVAAEKPEAVPQAERRVIPVTDVAPPMAVDTLPALSDVDDDVGQPVVGGPLLRAILFAGAMIAAISVLLALHIMRHLSREQP